MALQLLLEKPSIYHHTDIDGLWKKIISELFEEFILFFAPKLYEEIDFTKEVDFLQQELFQEIIKNKKGRRTADQIVKVPLKNGEDKWILVHIEVQNKVDQDFKKRMFRYFYRIFDQFDREIYAIALITDDKFTQAQDFYYYSYHDTTVVYAYNIYNFHDQYDKITELENSSNPFAAAVIAGIYATQSKTNMEKRYKFKRKLMIQILQRYTLPTDKYRDYLTALFYFIDYLLHTPDSLQEKLREDLSEHINTYKEDEIDMLNVDRMKLSPTLAGIIEDYEKVAYEEGIQDTLYQVVKELIKDGFSNERIMKLTKLNMDEIIRIRKNL